MTAFVSSSLGAPAYTEHLPCERESARRARRLVTAALDTWHLTALADAASVVVSELVTNAVQHGRLTSTIRVTVARVAERTVRVGVVDQDPKRPRRRAAGPDDEDGRGLRIVDALAARWGVEMTRPGTCVWVELEADQ